MVQPTDTQAPDTQAPDTHPAHVQPAPAPAAEGGAVRHDTVVFDLGGVLIDWNPRYLYRSLFRGPDAEAEMERFLATVCTLEWNAEQDRGRSAADATAELVARFPEHAELIAAYYGRWEDMLGEPIRGTVRIVDELRDRGYRLLALTNFSHETFPLARPRMAFLDHFDGLVVSGEEGVIKPEPAIFELLCERFDVDPARTFFVDDSPANVAAAAALGFDAVQFHSADQLRSDLADRGLLPKEPPGSPVD